VKRHQRRCFDHWRDPAPPGRAGPESVRPRSPDSPVAQP
jgi:hypothetical protein